MNYVDPDPLAGQIKQIFKLGWSHIPQVAHAGTENGVWRNVGGGVIDVVTLPDVGPATVVRLVGGPTPQHPRSVGTETWRHLVPVELAVLWILSDPDDDAELVEWVEQAAAHRQARRNTSSTLGPWPDQQAADREQRR